MFGYILIDKPEMRIKDYHIYRSYYCGLCRAIASYGQCARWLLNYDCVFLYLLLSALQHKPVRTERKKCMLHPTRKENIIFDDPADYTAAVNILLGVADLQDKKKDKQILISGTALMMMKSANIKAKEKYPFLDGVIQKNLEELAKLEEAREKDIDRAADPFAQLLAEIFTSYFVDKKEVLHELGYQLGRWIYLADAWEDRIEDRQKKRYNIFIEKFDQTENEAKESAEFNLKSAVNAAILAYDLLELQKKSGNFG